MVLAAGLAGPGRAADLPRADVDKRVGKIVYDTVSMGVELFNGGNPEGCFRLYQGTLMAVAPMLDHRQPLQAATNDALAKAKGQRANEGAFTLRKALDDVRAECEGTKPAGKPLWDRLGGEPAVRAVVHDFVAAAAPDPKVNFFRGKPAPGAAAVAKLEQLLVELVSQTTGGPLKYTGRTMKESHAGMKITEAEFNALAGHLIATLNKYKVPQAEQDELVKIVASTKNDIVEEGGAAAAPGKKALWDRLGGEPAVRAVVHDFVAAAAPDPKVNFFRGKPAPGAAAVEKLEQLLVELISQTTGGPLKYTGRSMEESHKGMKITEAEFNALAGHLIATLNKYKVPQAEQDELVKIVASTKDAIVGK